MFLVSHFVECALMVFAWCFSHDLTGVMSFGEDHGGKVPFSSYHIEGIYYQHDL